MMRVVFMGTPHFAAIILNELAHNYEVVGVYTRADAIRGRGRTLVASPVKEQALELGIPVFEPQTLKNDDEVLALRKLNPDIICVAAYGAILPREILDIPPLGCINVHASLLPRWRGAAPIERAILAGDPQAGVCIMRMEEGLDTGPWCAEHAIDIDSKNVQELTDELATVGAQMLVEAIGDIEQGTVHWVEQDESTATYAHKIEKGELYLDPLYGAWVNVRRVRASSSAHPARCVIAERNVTVLSARVVDDTDDVFLDVPDKRMNSTEEDGEIYRAVAFFVRKRLILSCSEGSFEVLSLKPDGKNQMDAASFVAGVPALRSSEGATWERMYE